jgi:DNA-binding NarL/FixJ family response regulator
MRADIPVDDVALHCGTGSHCRIIGKLSVQTPELVEVTVFLVEDSPAIREALIQRIEEDGRFRVIGCAETAADAIAQLDRRLPKVIIVDLHLKQGTGYDVLAHRAKSDKEKVTKAVVLTNFGSASHRRHAMELGADGFFDKSMQFEEMLDALRDWADSDFQNSTPPTA